MAHILLTQSSFEMNRKPVLYRNAKTVLNCKNTAFQEKHLCDGLTLNAGDACAATCSYCYVEAQLTKLLSVPLNGLDHQNVVIRRSNAVQLLRNQLIDKRGNDRFMHASDSRVVYSSTLVDCAANLKLAYETAQLATQIFEHTNWQVRLLSKFNFLPRVVEWIPERYHQRLILGVSTGTLDHQVAKSIEQGTASVAKRIESLHQLQDWGLRTFAMICPSLPQTDYERFAREITDAVRIDRCEHVWAEIINLRGQSFTRTIAALTGAGLIAEAEMLRQVCGPKSKPAWEEYSRATFEAYATIVPATKLRFLQYVTPQSLAWWKSKVSLGAVLLGKHASAAPKISSTPIPTASGLASRSSARSKAAHKAWSTIRLRYSASDIAKRQKAAAAKAWRTRRTSKQGAHMIALEDSP